MRLSEENELVLAAARQFATSEVMPLSLEIERSGLPAGLLAKMAGRGYLGAVVPDTLGGAGLSQTSYMLLLETLARHSPSLSFYAFLENSLVLRLLTDAGSQPGVREAMESVISGSGSGTVVLDQLISSSRAPGLRMEGSPPAVSGQAEYVLHPGASFFIAPAPGDGNQLLLIDGRGTVATSHPRLGFRGIGFARVEFSGGSARMLLPGGADGSAKAPDVLLSASREAGAIALGMAEEATARAVEYAGTRKTFGSRLEEYGPIANALSSMSAEIEVMREYLYSTADGGAREGLIAKLRLTELAVRASKLSMQVHGGNGYFEDYQIEKYYRDAMALQSLTGNRERERTELSHLLLGKGSAHI